MTNYQIKNMFSTCVTLIDNQLSLINIMLSIDFIGRFPILLYGDCYFMLVIKLGYPVSKSTMTIRH